MPARFSRPPPLPTTTTTTTTTKMATMATTARRRRVAHQPEQQPLNAGITEGKTRVLHCSLWKAPAWSLGIATVILLHPDRPISLAATWRGPVTNKHSRWISVWLICCTALARVG